MNNSTARNLAPSKTFAKIECPYCGLDRWARQDTIRHLQQAKPHFCHCATPTRVVDGVRQRRCKPGRHWVAASEFARLNTGKLSGKCVKCTAAAKSAPGPLSGVYVTSPTAPQVDPARVARNPLLCPMCAGMPSRVPAGERCTGPGCQTVGLP